MEMLVWSEENRKKKFEEMKKKKDALKKGEIKLLESNESCIQDSFWREEVTNDDNGKKLIEICKKCLMINPLERYHDGGQLLNALEDLAEDEEDLERKERDRQSLFMFQSWLLEFNGKNVRSNFRQDGVSLTDTSTKESNTSYK
jgi:hypothetical protein